MARGMERALLVSIFAVLCIAVAGCIGLPPKTETPLAASPCIIIDYDDTHIPGLTKIWVKGANTDYKYTNITITVTHDTQISTLQDNNTYCLQQNVNSSSFSLSIIVWDKTDRYAYLCNVTATPNEDYVLTITPAPQYVPQYGSEVKIKKNEMFKQILSGEKKT